MTSASLWTAAASQNTSESWVAVATALQDELASCRKDCLFLAHEVVEAWNKAVRAAGEDFMNKHESGAVPPITAASIAAMDTYVRLASPSDPDVEGLQLSAATTLDYRDQLAAIPRYEAFVNTYRDGNRSFAATLLIESLIRNRRADELKRVVADLLGDPGALEPELQTRLAGIQASVAAGEMPAAND